MAADKRFLERQGERLPEAAARAALLLQRWEAEAGSEEGGGCALS